MPVVIESMKVWPAAILLNFYLIPLNYRYGTIIFMDINELKSLIGVYALLECFFRTRSPFYGRVTSPIWYRMAK